MEVLLAKCPICQRVTRKGEDYFPFCSERCQTADLANWSIEAYRIPGATRPSRDEEEEDEDYDR
jgi:endogenous inhibitor of DNA gyrase (YacG/DUF329 family)